ncbi:MAG: 2-amino-4-hydroxy-6-hydroxymethyldihydropteridine diphosphokinase [Azonexus sp.]|jgi:2-amino-4-hydroxy-6-hydroxymethyldihydropteridine diphosphokinase|nr:2-amino-4-hydroxy-6-hydroxymethyldihydropteridine diphosphokinase [Azonexus sp.]
MSRAYIALGANLGDPACTLRAAFGVLANLPDVRLRRCSSLYRTAPVGYARQPDFINAAALVETALEPLPLLAELLAIEDRFGRQRSEKNGPRSLDLDLLLYDDRRFNQPQLTVPHPRLHLRAFVLQPLAEIAPDLTLPGRGPIAAWLPAVATQSVTRL